MAPVKSVHIECLELLRRYDASWKNIEWCKHALFSISRDQPGNSMEIFGHTAEEVTLSISYNYRLVYAEFPYASGR